MPTIKMTDVELRRLSVPAGERIEYFDQGTSGLCLRVSGTAKRADKDGNTVEKNGRRTWCCYYRHRGKLARLTLGQYPALSLLEARRKANDAMLLKMKGEDPRAVKRAAEDEASRRSDTVESVFELFVKRHLEAQHRAPSYISSTRALFANHVLPHWKGREIAGISRKDVNALLDVVHDGGGMVRRDGKRVRMPGGPIQANRTLAAIRAVMNFAVRRGIIEANPAALVERPGEEQQRDRVLSDDEVLAVWQAAGGLGVPFGPFLRVLLLTGQRRGEVAGMKWADLDLDQGIWTLQAESTKAGRLHVVPLTPAVVETIKAVPRISTRAADGRLVVSPLVFTTTGTTPVSGFGRVGERITKALAKDSAEDDTEADTKDGTEAEPWTLHDLRRTAATGMARLGATQFVIARVLNHTDHSVTAIYNRYENLNEKRHALEMWAQHVVNLTKPPANNVVPLRVAAG